MVEACAGSPLRDTLARALDPVVRGLVRPAPSDRLMRAVATVSAFTMKVNATDASFGLNVAAEARRGDSGDLESDLTDLIIDLGEAAQERGCGLAVLIDEAQNLTRHELEVLCATCHQGGQRAWPFLAALGGLPSLPRRLFEAKPYVERLFNYRQLDGLRDDAARQALIQAAASESVTWEDEAVSYVVEDTRGLPYFLQEYGRATWNAADGRAVLTLEDARVGASSALAHLGCGVLPRARSTPAQQAYLEAMAQDGAGPSQSGDVAARLGKTATGLGPSRVGLIKKGLIYVPRRGQVSFAMPAMPDFIARQTRP